MLKGLFKNLVGQASTIIDEVVTTDEERLQLKQQFESMVKNHEKQMFELEVADRKSARNMYQDDSFIQKVLAIIFTTAYFALSYIMFRYFVISESVYLITKLVLLARCLVRCQARLIQL